MCYIAYYRVSTKRQGNSGLGLEAQQKAVADFLQSRDGKLVAEYREVETGKDDDRPVLTEALHHAKVTGATLVVAKLDRLSRDAAFLMTLQKSGAKFTAADMPHLDNFTVGVMALVAQQEREAISKRTKDALAAAKARGVKLGGHREGSATISDYTDKSVKSRQDKADSFAQDLAPIVKDIQSAGHTSLRQIAKELEDRSIKTARGGDKWSAVTVKNLLARIENLKG